MKQNPSLNPLLNLKFAWSKRKEYTRKIIPSKIETCLIQNFPSVPTDSVSVHFTVVHFHQLIPSRKKPCKVNGRKIIFSCFYLKKKKNITFECILVTVEKDKSNTFFLLSIL